jgi:hypothetical protein
MKLALFGLICCFAFSCSNNSSPEKKEDAQNNTYLVTMEGIDSLKLGMSRTDLEKLLKIKLAPSDPKNYGSDTIEVKYKDMDMVLYLDGGSDSTATVRGIKTNSGACRTAGGIGVGSEKTKVIDAFEDHLKYVAPEYEAYPVRSTTKSAIAVMDTLNTNALLFHILDKKVAAVAVHSYYEFY